MKPRFKVDPGGFESLHELPNAWSERDFRDILTALDFDDAGSIAPDELREMCLMALADLEPEASAEVLLHHRLGDRLREGQIDDLAHDIVDQPMWEDYPEMRVHEELYNINQLLYDAFNGHFPRPRAVRLTLDVTALDEEGAVQLERPTEPFLVRLIAGGLRDESALHRLFEDQLSGTAFPEAESILWQFERHGADGASRFVLVGSAYWLSGMKDTGGYETTSHPDVTASTTE